MRCERCGAENREGVRFCTGCGSALGTKCARCGTDNQPGDRFCGSCGAPLSGASPAREAASAERAHGERPVSGAPARGMPGEGAGTIAEPAAPDGERKTKRDNVERSPERSESASGVEGPRRQLEGERKTVTALFADIKGSTELEQDLDPEEARAIVDPALKLMIDAVRRYDGYIVQSTGDGIFALFGAPVAHEDHPQRALYAAIRIQEDVHRYADKLRAEGRSPLQIRIGADTGEMVLRTIETGGKTEYTPIGHAANLASRMQSLANPGSTVISESTRKLVEGYFTLRSLGPSRVKGIAEPVNVYEVTGFGPLRTRLQRSASRGYTKFVGREREMDAMKHAAEQAKAGHGQIVAAMADAGVGKSRLFYEFKAVSQRGWLVLEAPSFSHSKATAYLPVLDLLHGYFRITPDDDQRTRREKVNGRIVTLDPALEDTRPYLFALLGIAESEDPLAQMDAQVRRRRTEEAIKRILLHESLNQALMLIFEDLHWIDQETQTFLNLLAEGIASAPVLLLVNYRPEYSHQWGSKTYYTQLRLDPLGQESAAEMLSALVGDAPDVVPLKRLVLERTQGNPLFMEELVQALFEEGVLVRNGAVKVTRSLSQLKIPPTVQGILAARIDRLPPEEKQLLQTLAVLGKEFPLTLARAVVQRPDDDLDRMLNHLQLAEFIYEQPGVGGIEYTFKHALTHDVAYNSVLVERRKALHECVGRAVEELYANSIDDHLDELAYHYGRSANPAKALEYHERAGMRAIQRSAVSEVVRNFTLALEFLQRLPQGAQRDKREFALQTGLGPALMAAKGWAAPETERAYLRAEQLAATRGTPEQHFALLVGLFGIAFTGSGNLTAARERLKQTWDFVDQHPEPPFVLEATHHDWSTALSAGELATAQHHVERGLAFYEERLRAVRIPLYSAHHPAVCGHAWGAQVFWLRGRPDLARQHANQAVSLAQELGDSVSVVWALGNKALVHRITREVQAALEIAEAAIAKAEEMGFPYVLRNAAVVKGWALAELGRQDQGVDLVREQIAALSATRAELWLTLNWATLAEACARAGQIDEGLKATAEALDLVRQRGECFWEAEIHRLSGELLLMRDRSDCTEAQASFKRAIEVARRQGAKSLELRATRSLARLLRDTGCRDEARAMLAEIYNWFTEGFDTADLKDAKALLDELGA